MWLSIISKPKNGYKNPKMNRNGFWISAVGSLNSDLTVPYSLQPLEVAEQKPAPGAQTANPGQAQGKG